MVGRRLPTKHGYCHGVGSCCCFITVRHYNGSYLLIFWRSSWQFHPRGFRLNNTAYNIGFDIPTSRISHRWSHPLPIQRFYVRNFTLVHIVRAKCKRSRLRASAHISDLFSRATFLVAGFSLQFCWTLSIFICTRLWVIQYNICYFKLTFF